MTRISNEILAKIDDLQTRYMRAVDSKNMDGWLNTFCSDGDTAYICTTAESVEANRPLALILDDCRARLEDRVTFVTKIWAGTYSSYRTRHIITRTNCNVLEDGLISAETNFAVFCTPSDTGRAEMFATGVYLDRINVDGAEALFRSRKVITDNALIERYLVYPL